MKERSRYKVIYHWSGSGLAGPLAAAMHLGFVSKDAEASVLKKINLPFGGGFTGQNRGSLLYLGRAEQGEEIYILPRGRQPELIIRTLQETASLFGDDPIYYRFIDCEPGKAVIAINKRKFFTWLSQTVTQVEEGLGG